MLGGLVAVGSLGLLCGPICLIMFCGSASHHEYCPCSELAPVSSVSSKLQDKTDDGRAGVCTHTLDGKVLEFVVLL